MFKHRLHEQVGFKTTFDWLMLAFVAGIVNTGGWLACHRFVTHVTGFATLAGVDAASGNWVSAISTLTVPVYFVCGTMVAAYLTEHRLHAGKLARYSWVMCGVFLLLGAAGIAGELDWFGVFGAPIVPEREYLLLAMLCAASGLQNAAVSSASGATIRSTHLTGITTDLGVGLVRAASLPVGDERRRAETRANWLRVGTIVVFMLGSAIGAVLFLRFQFAGFLLPALIAAYATFTAATQEARAVEA